MSDTVAGILLTRRWRDAPDGLEFDLWAATDDGPIRIRIGRQESVCFIDRDAPIVASARREPVELKTLSGQPVDALYFQRESQLRALRQSGGPSLHESDVNPVERFLMERFIFGCIEVEGEALDRGAYREFLNPVIRPADRVPKLRVLSIDIETSGLTGELYSIATAGAGGDRVFMRGGGPDTGAVAYCEDEGEVLQRFYAHLDETDPDLLIGWNVVDFDLKFLEVVARRCGLPFRLGRAGLASDILPPAVRRQSSRARIPGRAVLDGIWLMRTATYAFESFSLENVANEVLGRGKLIDPHEDKLAEIQRLFREDKPALAAYNLEDCRLVLDLFEKTKLIDFAVQRSRITGLALDRQGGSVAGFEYQYLPRLHRRGYVAPDVEKAKAPEASPGGYILDSQPGLFRNVLVFDFKSLYPSIIRTFQVDPLGMAQPGENPVEGFRGATFAREGAILPELIETLWAERDAAKRAGDTPLSTAIKIIMNSFYGVLGTPGCRFHHPSLVESITRRGHEIIRRSRDWIEERGYPVIYGDTDSVFVHAGDDRAEADCLALGNQLAAELTAWWTETVRREHGIPSFLDLEFETHYLRFLMPTVRGAGAGSKKRYAGLVRAGEDTQLIVKGLEAVRTDWTPLARAFQTELLRRAFHDEPFEKYVRQLAAEVVEGVHDNELLYTKRLRRPIDEYRKNVPPHVRAARQLDRPPRRITYAITVHGPQPVQKLSAGLDYAHYLDRQLAPVADAILQFFGTSFEAITADQLEMF